MIERSDIVKIFIAGARSVQNLDSKVQRRMMTICQKGYDVLVGDCYGVDASVQKFYSDLGYNNVTVFASNGKARNNIGNWNIRNIAVPLNVKGFDFYKQKDIAMTNEADYGFMIWDGESRGTLNNTINLIAQHKKVLMYLTAIDRMVVVKSIDDLNQIVDICAPKTKTIFYKLLQASK